MLRQKFSKNNHASRTKTPQIKNNLNRLLIDGAYGYSIVVVVVSYSERRTSSYVVVFRYSYVYQVRRIPGIVDRSIRIFIFPSLCAHIDCESTVPV